MGFRIKEKLGRYQGDKVILILIAILMAISTLLVYSTEGNLVLKHLGSFLCCIAGGFFFYIIDYKKTIQVTRRFILLAAGLLLGFTIISSGVRGIVIKGHSIQTFYGIGLLVIIWLSNFIGRRLDDGLVAPTKDNMNVATFILIVFCVGIGAMNMSTAIILFGTGITIFFIGKFKWRRIFIIVAFAVAGVIALTILVKSGKLDNIGRFNTFIGRWEYYFTKDNNQGYGDQMIFSRAAIARSGFHPAGPGRGVIKHSLPENSTDYAYASLFEEFGIVVGLIIIFIYISFFYRTWKIAKESKSAVGALLSFGIGFWLTCQAFVHIGVNCELLPATGQTLPFVSTGGMSMIVSGCAVGLVLNVSRRNIQDDGKPEAKDIFIQSNL